MVSDPRRITEAEFQRQVTDLATILGWSWVHFRPAQTSKGWRTPVSGPLGKGWPDLLLFRPRDKRAMAFELKRQGGKVSLEQRAVQETLSESGLPMFVVYPDDLERIEVMLR